MICKSGDNFSAARLEDFLNDCVGSPPEEEGDRIREAIALFAMPDVASSQPADVLARMEALLVCGGPVDAVLAILGAQTAFLLSRAAAGNCLATVVVEEGGEEILAEGATPALALLAAFTSAALARAQYQYGTDGSEDPGTRPGARFH